MTTLESGKDSYDEIQASRGSYQPTQQQQQWTPEQVVNSMTGLIPEERDWLLKHPEMVVDQRRVQELQGAFWSSQRLGLQRGTPEYFKHIEERTGAGDTRGLTAAQKDAAKISGVSESEYLKQYNKMKETDAQYGPRYQR